MGEEGEEEMPKKGTLAWIHKYNQGSPVFGDPDNMINTRTADKETLDSFESVTVMIDGEPEEVYVDPDYGPLKLQLDGTARSEIIARNQQYWKWKTSTMRATDIAVCAKVNRQIKEKIAMMEAEKWLQEAAQEAITS
mmetsp:Transcript_31956/g.58284  ORF Transcript_31956/g.58284 Transcript_31956/m.58284 type:complete len:137 (+) Transcript_31956:56-466(+)